MNILLFGAPGAGKGAQGERLADRFGLLRLSTGDLLRDAVKKGTSLGLEARRFMDAGELVPDSVILGLVRDALENPRDGAGVIFDGFPRTVAQAAALATLLRDLGQALDAILVLEVSDDEIVRRLSGRLSCPACRAVYNLFSDPPARTGVCDRCGTALVQRDDDREDTVRRRLAVYRDQTAPVLAWYRGTGVRIHDVPGDRGLDEVQADLVRLLGP
jgi:adenylate kinase